MILKSIKTVIWKYDRIFTAIVATLPVGLQRSSTMLGRMTLPSIWATVVTLSSVTAYTNGYTEMAILGFIVLVFIPVGTILKLFVRRSRPTTIYAQNMKVKSYSFPSSHAYAGAIAAGYMALLSLAVMPTPIGTILAAIYGILIFLIGISRIHVGAHYPTDVTAGWIIGLGVLYVITNITL